MNLALTLASIIILGAWTLPAAEADPSGSIKSAIKKLADQPNYSWTATPRSDGASDGGNSGPVEGKSEKDGCTICTFAVGDNEIAVAFKGDKHTLRYQDMWLTPEDIEGAGQEAIAKRLRAFRSAAGDAAALADKLQKSKKEADGAISGSLNDEGAKEFLALARRAGSGDGKDAKATARFWIKDGMLSKYQWTVQGKVEGRDGGEVELNRTTTVEFKDVGKTKVSVPEEAQAKLK